MEFKKASAARFLPPRSYSAPHNALKEGYDMKFNEQTIPGKTGLKVGRLGIASGYSIGDYLYGRIY